MTRLKRALVSPNKTETDPDSPYTPKDVDLIYENPHLLGWMVGKKDLLPIHSEWINYIWNPELNKDPSIQAHRGSYKSTSISQIGPIKWFLFEEPNDRIFIIRKKFTEASDFITTTWAMIQVREIQELFKYVHGRYPKTNIKRKEKITFDFKTTLTPEGSLNALGIDGNITGAHGDKFILDDFVTDKDRISKAERENTKNTVREIRTNVRDKGKFCAFIGTPWHKDDAWTICPLPLKYSVYDLDILTEEEIAQKRRTTTGSLFAANYELLHVPSDGALFRDAIWDDWRFNGIGLVQAHLDAAFDGDHYNALTIMAQRNDGKIQGVGFTYAGNVKYWFDEIKTYCLRYKVKRIHVEDNPDKGYTADDLKKRGLHAISYTETTNKHVKIATYLVEKWGDIVWSQDTDSEYMNQILDYQEKQEPDDAPDSAGSLIRQAFSHQKSSRKGRYEW